jgi:hypothetical protein
MTFDQKFPDAFVGYREASWDAAVKSLDITFPGDVKIVSDPNPFVLDRR